MAHKVLNLLWSLAHSEDVPTEIMDQALSAHMKILDYSCSQVGLCATTAHGCVIGVGLFLLTGSLRKFVFSRVGFLRFGISQGEL